MPDYSTIAPQSSTATPAAAKDVMPVQEQLQNEPDLQPLQKTSIQFKLAIGAPDDPLEHEADAMANTIMRMPEQNFIQRKCAGCEEEEKLQRKPLFSVVQKKEASSVAVASNALSIRINSSKGNGSNMDSNTQSFMQSRFSADFSDVKIHTGGEAIQMNRELNAKAFTVGNDIYFNEGQYNPASNEGKHLLAHELTHTLQQGALIKRSIEIDGKPYTPTPDDYSKYNKELLDKMYNGGLPPLNTFKTQKEFEDTLNIRANSITNMRDGIETDNWSVNFGTNKVTGNFELPGEFWQPMDKDWFQLKEGLEITPAKAVRSIFNSKEQSYLDCNMLMVALQYKSILDTYGDDKFNLMFPAGKGLIISQGSYKLPESGGGNHPIENGKHPFADKAVFNDVIKKESDTDSNKMEIDPTDPTKKLIPGDWVYFRNNEKYTYFAGEANKLSDELYLYTHQILGKYANEWQGEHALYVGENKFLGFGLYEAYNYEAMINMLYDAFNHAMLAYYNHPYYSKKFLDDGGERAEKLAKTQKEWEPAKITGVKRINSGNIDKLGK